MRTEIWVTGCASLLLSVAPRLQAGLGGLGGDQVDCSPLNECSAKTIVEHAIEANGYKPLCADVRTDLNIRIANCLQLAKRCKRGSDFYNMPKDVDILFQHVTCEDYIRAPRSAPKGKSR